MSQIINAEQARALTLRRQLTFDHLTEAVKAAAAAGFTDITFDNFKYMLSSEMEKQIEDLGYTIVKSEKTLYPQDKGEFYYTVSWKK